MVGTILYKSNTTFFWAEAIRGIEDALNGESYHLVLGNDNGNIEKAKQYIESFAAKGIDGLIIVPIGKPTKQEYEEENFKLIKVIEKMDIPYTLFHRSLAGKECSVVTSKNYEDTFRMIDEFVKSGIRDPICISHYYTSPTFERERGFRDALEKNGISDASSRIFHLRFTGQDIGEENRNEIVKFINDGEHIDGVFAVSDQVLSELLNIQSWNHMLKEKKISYVGFGYSEVLFANENLSMLMVQPAYEMGVLAGEMILSTIKHWKDASFRVSIPSTLKRRKDMGALE